MTISEMLAANARLYRGEPALVELRPSTGARKVITWREFDDSANRVAAALLDRGVGKGDRVVHLMRNSIDWLVVFFGIIRTGAWAVPLNHRFNGRDIQYCVNAAGARLMVLAGEFAGSVTAVRSQMPAVSGFMVLGETVPDGMEGFAGVMAASSSAPVTVPLDGGDGCALYFTTGTAGAPRPVLLTHRNMEFAAETEKAHHHHRREDNSLIIPPFFHAGAKMHWFGSLAVGGRATLLTEVIPQYIFETVHNERATIVWLLVPWVQDILAAMDRGELKREDYDLGCWRLMHMGAQPVPPDLVRRWKRVFPAMQYDTNYGLTEASGPGCVHLGIENERKLGAIGRPGLDWQVRIVDDLGRDVPQGQAGELVVKGDGVMKEYYRNPDATARAIRDGWLYTGDIGKMDGEGFIYLVDRKKQMIITGGEKIFPQEVEEVLQGHPKICGVAALGMPDDRLGEVVAVVVEPRPGRDLTREEVNRFCEENLSRYKMPRRVILGGIPRDAAGNIDRPGLRQKYVGAWNFTYAPDW